MNVSTRQQLVDQTKEFYDLAATKFNSTRQQPWTGWYELLPLVNTITPLSLVDWGCGNGRWFKFLIEHQLNIRKAVGIDNSRKLLDLAYINKNIEYIEGSVLDNNSLSGNCVTAFGLWHHIPGRKTRKQLLEKMLKMLDKPGILIISLWHMPGKEGVDTREGLEDGDLLIGWDNQPGLVRYCHRFDESEIQDLMTLSADTIGRFEADGKDNVSNTYLYYIRR